MSTSSLFGEDLRGRSKTRTKSALPAASDCDRVFLLFLTITVVLCTIVSLLICSAMLPEGAFWPKVGSRWDVKLCVYLLRYVKY